MAICMGQCVWQLVKQPPNICIRVNRFERISLPKTLDAIGPRDFFRASGLLRFTRIEPMGESRLGGAGGEEGSWPRAEDKVFITFVCLSVSLSAGMYEGR